MLTLGIAASVAIFTFVDAVLLKSLPYPNPSTLVDVGESTATSPQSLLSYLDYLDWKRLNHSFRSFDIYIGTRYLLRTASGTEAVPGEIVSNGFFRTLGISPMLGRDFYSGEDLPNAPHSAILSYATWQKRYAGKKDVIGQSASLSGIPYTIIGVMPQDFQFAPRGDAEFWTNFHGNDACNLQRGCHGFFGIARLNDGVAIQAALSDLSVVAKQLEHLYPATNRDQGAAVRLLSELIIGEGRPILLLLLGGAGLLLLIGCINVSSLLLVRSESRRQEIALRGALGASHARIARQFVTEALLLVFTSTLVGMPLAYVFSRIILQSIPADMIVSMPFLNNLKLNSHVLFFAVAIAFLMTGVFSLVPVLRLSSTNVRNDLNEGSRTSASTLWHRLGANLVIFELAISVVLLVSAGLFSKSAFRLLHVDLNFQPDHLATVHLLLPETIYTKEEQINVMHKQLLNRIAALPGVTSVSTTTRFPLSGNGNTTSIRFFGRGYSGKPNEVNRRDISANFFTPLQTRLLRGRFFTKNDDLMSPRVVIINQTLARQHFPNEDPIGKKIGDTDLSPKSLAEIVGIVDDLREASLGDQIAPAVYYPAEQNAGNWFNIIARTSQDEKSLLPILVSTIHQAGPDIGTGAEATMNQLIDDAPDSFVSRFIAYLVSSFATIALLLSAIGLYGVIAD